EKHFRRFIGQAPTKYLRDVRLERARQELLRAPRESSIADVAAHCGFGHLGRFAAWYCQRYGETPSATLRGAQIGSAGSAPFRPLAPSAYDRPTVAILPFDLVGDEARHAAGMAEEIATALLRLRWINVST